RGAKHIRLATAPLHGNHHDADAVRPPVVGKRAPGLQPSADEMAARMLRPALVDRAAVVAAEEARRARLHLVAFDLADNPAVAARGAFAALARISGGDGDGGAAALLVLLAAAAGARIVAADGHGSDARDGASSIL